MFSTLLVAMARPHLAGCEYVPNCILLHGPANREEGPPPLPATKLSSGDIVSLVVTGAAGLKDIGTGVITRATPTRVSVAFDEAVAEAMPPGQLALIKLSNDVTYRRMKT